MSALDRFATHRFHSENEQRKDAIAPAGLLRGTAGGYLHLATASRLH